MDAGDTTRAITERQMQGSLGSRPACALHGHSKRTRGQHDGRRGGCGVPLEGSAILPRPRHGRYMRAHVIIALLVSLLLVTAAPTRAQSA
ncbi:hypothetical protein LN96_13595 [Xanthomonas citri pv. citri]|uniref:Uncharacterized protein n=1 Tax=Xanthomonas citri pv. citri TaxID=611301 RepID=A0A0U5BP86_XANCI|nr:hypothetical protein AB890_03100 [Xanthomonas citri pv. citri]ARR14856.1 hypothetical protein B7L66_23725 [Xanthomonas citri pv. citri]ARR19074.1 hypothetical protein B7L65_20745 [Xanthomonas citri pv. citri]ARR20839.1 hypothetical protein B7L67_03955 [Xanthomonas citri pv. citri]AUZ49767.1 hypothetical protein CLM98_03665 [Xanthomonas citri pv. citri]